MHLLLSIPLILRFRFDSVVSLGVSITAWWSNIHIPFQKLRTNISPVETLGILAFYSLAPDTHRHLGSQDLSPRVQNMICALLIHICRQITKPIRIFTTPLSQPITIINFLPLLLRPSNIDTPLEQTSLESITRVKHAIREMKERNSITH